MIGRLASFLRRRGVDLQTFESVFDIGSRDALQAVELAGLFPNAEIVAIECNPSMLEVCRRNTAPHGRIKLVEKAVHSHTGRCQFHPIDTERTITTWPDGNPGASSLFLATGDYPAEHYVQNTIEVDCVRLDDLCGQLGIDVIDLIWMDLQGAELLALESAGALLEKTRYIFTEVSYRPLYRGQCLFDDVDSLLKARGFRCCTHIDRNRWQQDVIYENTRPLIDALIPLGPKDRDTVERSVRSIQTFVPDVRRIYVLGAEDPAIPGTRYVDERAFPFDRDAVERHIAPARPGGFLQQLEKMHFQLVHGTALEHVLALDAGTVFLKPCRFMDGTRPILNFGDEYAPAVFEHMARLAPQLHRMIAYSGITHAMLFTRAWLRELHEAVEAHHPGKRFWEIYLESIDPAAGERGASEAEIYFNFCLMFHPGELTIRRFNWANAGSLEALGDDRPDYVCLHRELRTGTPEGRIPIRRMAGGFEASET